MVRIATLFQPDQRDPARVFLPQADPAAQNPADQSLDILCCQIRQQHRQELKDSQDYLRQLAASVQMACSSTVLAASQGKRQNRTMLSMFTASSVWMLNSGSINLPASSSIQHRVQFALVRKASSAVLVINSPSDANCRERLALVRALFSHQIFKEQQYAAVLFCAERGLRVSRREAGQLMHGTGFTLHTSLQAEDGGTGSIMLFTSRDSSLAAGVELGRQGACQLVLTNGEAAKTEACALMLEFQIQPVLSTTPKKPRLPLSFAEQWAGYKEHLRPSAV